MFRSLCLIIKVFGHIGSSFWLGYGISVSDWHQAFYRDPCPHSMNSNSRTRRMSVLQLNSAGVTAGDWNTHDLGTPGGDPIDIANNHCCKRDASGSALWTAKKAFGWKMARPAPCPASSSSSSERLMLPRSWSVPEAFWLEKTHQLYSWKNQLSCSVLVLCASKLCRWF